MVIRFLSVGKMGLKVIAYMAVGIPCVCSPVGDHVRFVRDGENGMIASTEEEWVEKLSEDVKSQLDGAVEKGKEALKTGDTDAIKAALEELNGAYSAAGASLYQAESAQQTTSEGEAEPPSDETAGGDDDVVDADYEIVDEPK